MSLVVTDGGEDGYTREVVTDHLDTFSNDVQITLLAGVPHVMGHKVTCPHYEVNFLR